MLLQGGLPFLSNPSLSGATPTTLQQGPPLLPPGAIQGTLPIRPARLPNALEDPTHSLFAGSSGDVHERTLASYASMAHDVSHCMVILLKQSAGALQALARRRISPKCSV